MTLLISQDNCSENLCFWKKIFSVLFQETCLLPLQALWLKMIFSIFLRGECTQEALLGHFWQTTLKYGNSY